MECSFQNEFGFSNENGFASESGLFQKAMSHNLSKNAEFANFENGGSAPCMFANHQIIKIFRESVALLRLSLMDKRVDTLTACEIRSDNV